MTFIQELRENSYAPGVTETQIGEGLSAIHRSNCAAVVWRRHLAPCLQHWIDMLNPERLPRARVILRSEDVLDAVTQICEASGTPDCVQRAMLIEDTSTLARIFSNLVQSPYLRLRYDVVATDACRKFHIDTVKARIICTYRGPGTQYRFLEDARNPDAQVFSVETGEPILLRGKLWPESPDVGLRHRSPPIEGTGQTRLVLVLDPIMDPDSHSEQNFLH